jgi:hypothetical protein
MLIAYVAVGTLTAAANATAATLDFRRSQWVIDSMTRVGVNPSSLYPLGLLKAAGAVGLLVGIALAPLGVAAAIGLVLFFVAAIAAHIRAHDYPSIPFPAMFHLMAIASLAIRLASS